jgi:hypothetical protein
MINDESQTTEYQLVIAINFTILNLKIPFILRGPLFFRIRICGIFKDKKGC